MRESKAIESKAIDRSPAKVQNEPREAEEPSKMARSARRAEAAKRRLSGAAIGAAAPPLGLQPRLAPAVTPPISKGRGSSYSSSSKRAQTRSKDEAAPPPPPPQPPSATASPLSSPPSSPKRHTPNCSPRGSPRSVVDGAFADEACDKKARSAFLSKLYRLRGSSGERASDYPEGLGGELKRAAHALKMRKRGEFETFIETALREGRISRAEIVGPSRDIVSPPAPPPLVLDAAPVINQAPEERRSRCGKSAASDRLGIVSLLRRAEVLSISRVFL